MQNEKEIIKKLEKIEKLLEKLLKKKEKKKSEVKPCDDRKMSVDQFVEWCKIKKDMRHITLIGEWAETVRPSLTKRSQWQEYLRANVGHSKKLLAFTDEQIADAFLQIQRDIHGGCHYKPSLSTILKKLTK